MYGAVRCSIINNTVVDINDATPGPSWIAIVPNKDGTPSEDCIIRNNIATHVTVSEGVSEDHNYIVENYSDYNNIFNDFSSFDLHVKSGNTAIIDAGSDSLAPDYDFEGNPRPAGNGYDIGAYENR